MPQGLLQWTLANKTTVLLALLTFCLLISTIALSLERDKCSPSANILSKSDGMPSTELKQMLQNNYYRLPRSIIPKNYKLILSPNMTSNVFEGILTITLRVLEPVETITLHSNKLNIQKVTLRKIDNAVVPVRSTNITSDNREMLHIQLNNKISPEYYQLEIKFDGNLTKKIVGFYASRLKSGR